MHSPDPPIRPAVLLRPVTGAEDRHGEEEKGRTGRPGPHLPVPVHTHQPGPPAHDLAGQLAALRVDHHPDHHGQLRRHGAGRQTVQQRQVHHVHQTGEKTWEIYSKV